MGGSNIVAGCTEVGWGGLGSLSRCCVSFVALIGTVWNLHSFNADEDVRCMAARRVGTTLGAVSARSRARGKSPCYVSGSARATGGVSLRVHCRFYARSAVRATENLESISEGSAESTTPPCASQKIAQA